MFNKQRTNTTPLLRESIIDTCKQIHPNKLSQFAKSSNVCVARKYNETAQQ